MLKSLYGRFKSFIIIKGYRKELKGIIEHKSLIISRAFILISNMSKTRSIKDNSDLSEVFLKLIVDEELTSQEDELLEEVIVFKDELLEDELITKTLVNYFLLKSFYNSFSNASSYSFFEKATRIDNNILRIESSESFKKICKVNKNKLKDTLNKCQHINAERVEREKVKRIKSITITYEHVKYFISLLSVLFLISGFIYNMFLFRSFNVNISYYFTISDYLSSSLNEVVPIFIISFIGIFYFMLGRLRKIGLEIHEELCDISKQDSWLEKLVMISYVIFTIVIFVNEEHMNYFLFAPIVVLLYTYLLNKFTFWKYIKNAQKAIYFISGIMFLLIYLSASILNKIDYLNSENYESKSFVKYKEEYKMFSNSKFISANSKYLFVLNKNKEVIILPLNAIDYIRSKK